MLAQKEGTLHVHEKQYFKLNTEAIKFVHSLQKIVYTAFRYKKMSCFNKDIWDDRVSQMFADKMKKYIVENHKQLNKPGFHPSKKENKLFTVHLNTANENIIFEFDLKLPIEDSVFFWSSFTSDLRQVDVFNDLGFDHSKCYEI
jgi:hypothetical protein